MLKLTLTAKQGNGVRFFPHAGYLRMTPLKIEGIVRTRIDEDNKPLLCSGLYVALRCYEARLGLGLGLGLGGGSGSSSSPTTSATVDNGIAGGNGNPNLNILFEILVPLWNASTTEYELLGNGEWPFKIIVPLNASPVCSTVHFQEYRVFWRVEAVLTHAPITGVGIRLVKLHDIPLIRYDSGQDLPPQPPNKWRRVSLPSRSPRLPPSILKYIINTSPFPLAPLDHVPVTLKLSLPPLINVASIALSIERRLTFKFAYNAVHDRDAAASSTAHLIQPPQPSSKSSSTTVLTSVTHPLAPSDRKTEGVSYNRTITLQIPQAKSLSHWSLGETIHTPLASVRFFLRAKITIVDSQLYEDPASSRPSSPSPTQSPNSSQTQSHSYTLDLHEKELYVISTNEADRREAFTKYRDALRRGRKRKVTSSGKEKEKESVVSPVSDIASASAPPSATPSEPSTACGRSPSHSLFKSKSKSKSKSRPRKDKENQDDSQQASAKGRQNGREETEIPSPSPSSPPSPSIEPRSLKKIKRPSTSEGRTTTEINTEEPTSSSHIKVVKSKEKKPFNRGTGLTLGLGLLTPRSRKYRRQGRASDGDGDIENDVDADDYDGEYVFVDNDDIPLSAPPIRRLSRRRHPMLPNPSSPYETSADEGGRVVVYLQDGMQGRGVDKAVVTNASTNTSTSEGTEENVCPPTPPDEPLFAQSHDRKTLPLHLSVHPPSSYHPIPESSRSWFTLPRPALPVLRSPSTPLRDDEKDVWEIELERMIGAGKEITPTEKEAIPTTKAKAKKSSTIAVIGFRKKNNKTSKNSVPVPAPDLSLSPTSCSEIESQAQSPIHPPASSSSSLSPVYIPHSTSTPALPVSAPTKPKPTSKPKTKTFGIGWGFGWS